MEYDHNSILKNLCKHLQHFAGSDIKITSETDLINELSIDSVKLLNLVMEIEDEFDITVPIKLVDGQILALNVLLNKALQYFLGVKCAINNIIINFML